MSGLSGYIASMTQVSGYRERNSTADRALNILQMFSEEAPEISAAEVAESLGVARSTAYRYVQTLVQAQFLSDTGHGAFRLGSRILELARIARSGRGLSDLSIPVMRELAERFQQTVLLTKRSGNAVVCLEREEARGQYVRLSYERGSVLQLHAGASAQVLLAWTGEQQVRQLLATAPLQKFTENTLTEPDAIVARLARIREDGFAVTDGEVDRTAMGIAAPIFQAGGAVYAAVSVVLIKSLVSPEEIEDIVEAVISAAATITNDLSLLEG